MENKKLFTKSENFKNEYCCTIVKLGECFNIEGKDKIQRTEINGEGVVISKELLPGTILFYASNETQLDKEFLSKNNLFESCELNSNREEVEPIVNDNKDLKAKCEELENVIKSLYISSKRIISYDSDIILAEGNQEDIDEINEDLEDAKKCIIKYISELSDVEFNPMTFVSKAQERCAKLKFEFDELKKEIENNNNFIRSHVGFFNKTGRVRSIRLGGVQSMGYLFSLEELAKYNPKVKEINIEELVGEDFDTVDGQLFIKAYVPFVPETRKRDKNEKRNKKIEQFDRMIKGEFSFHFDTQPFPKCVSTFKPTDNVLISNKLHGCVEYNSVINTLEYGDLIIGDIVNKKINCHIKAYDTDANAIVYVPIDNFYTIPNDGEWYEIELENGKKITITGNNPIWLPELGVYRRVDELNGDEKILFSDD